MRAWEILSEQPTPSRPVSLRALHTLKQQAWHREEADAKRHALMAVM